MKNKEEFSPISIEVLNTFSKAFQKKLWNNTLEHSKVLFHSFFYLDYLGIIFFKLFKITKLLYFCYNKIIIN